MATKNTTNPYKPGDIVTTTWGYSMTIVDFYEVIRVTPCKVELRQLCQHEEMTGYLSGIDNAAAFRNSVAYIQNWMQALKNDPKMIVWAASRAEKAARYIIGGPEAIKVSTL